VEVVVCHVVAAVGWDGAVSKNFSAGYEVHHAVRMCVPAKLNISKQILY
jgi:hypothetical protein